MRPFLIPTLLLAASVGGCFDGGRPAQSPEPEYSDQEEYANTPTEGPGAESQSGYYGVGNSSGPSHQPASPAGGGHQPH